MSRNQAKYALIKQGAALTVGTLVQALTGLIAQITLMRLLLPEDFGQFVVVLAGCSLVQTILSLRLNVLIIRLSTNAESNDQARLYQAALIWETVIAALLALIWLWASDLISGPSLILLASLTVGQWVNQIVAFYERGMNYGRITIVETGSQLAGHAIALIIVLSGLGAIGLYLREFASILFKLIAYGAIGALPRPVWVWPRLDACRQIWREARGVWAEGILEGVFARLIILTAGAMIGLHGAGLFAQSHRLAMLPHQFLAPVISRMSANLFNRTSDLRRRRYLAWRLGLATIALMLPGIAITWFWAVDIVPWLFGEKWREAGSVLRAMIGVMLFLSLFDLLRSFCYAHKWVRPVLWARATQILVFAIPALFIFTPQVETLAWILSVTFAAAFTVFATLTMRMIKRSQPDG